MSGLFNGVKHVNGQDTALHGAVDKTLIAAPGVGKRIYVQTVHISVLVGGTDAGGLASLEDGVGGTKFFSVDADATTSALTYSHTFGEPGWPLSLNTALNLTVDGDGTAEATAQAVVTGIVI